jgi:hypothetical protein
MNARYPIEELLRGSFETPEWADDPPEPSGEESGDPVDAPIRPCTFQRPEPFKFVSKGKGARNELAITYRMTGLSKFGCVPLPPKDTPRQAAREYLLRRAK